MQNMRGLRNDYQFYCYFQEGQFEHCLIAHEWSAGFSLISPWEGHPGIGECMEYIKLIQNVKYFF